MKKIMNTTLVAIALAIASVSSVDARIAKSTMGTPAKESATNMIEAAKMVVDNPTAQNKVELATVINEEANTPEKQETLKLRAEIKRIEDAITLVNERKKDIGYRWYSIFASQDTKKADMAASDRLRQLRSELKDAQMALKNNEQVTGKPWSISAKYVVGAVITTGIAIGAIADTYYGTGYMSRAKDYVANSRVGQAAGRAGRYSRAKAGEAGTYMQTKAGQARTAANDMYYGKPTVTTPTVTAPKTQYNLPEYR